MKPNTQSLYKLISALILLVGFQSEAYSQNCEIHATATPETIFCGQEAVLSVFAYGDGTVMMDENFNNGSFGPGWSSTPGSVMWNNPCSPGGVDGTAHAWMGNNTSVPRDIVTTAYNLTAATAGVTICFDLLFATQGAASPCEGPDEPTEGVYLQYSTDGGTTWVTINYFDPEGGYNTPYTQWGNWCFVIPNAAITSSTQFRWHQSADSGQDYDHWGIDNVQIVQNDVNATIAWGNPGDSYYHNYGVGSPGGENPNHVSPTTTTTYTVQITTGSGDVCTDQVTVTVIDPVYQVDVDVNPTPICVGDCADLTGSAVQVIDPGGIVTFDQNELNPVGGFGAGSIGADVNINVQGINSPTIYTGLIQEVCIHNFTYWATGFTIAFPPQPINVNISDFEFTLVCPDGSQITLIPQGSLQPSTSSGSLNGVCFIPVGGATNLGSQTQPYSGTYDPAQPFSNLNGCNPNGVWTIIATAPSGIAIGVGNFSGWSITFDNPPIHNNIDYTWSPTTNLSSPTSGTNTQNINNQACPTVTTTYNLTVSNGVPGCATHTEAVQVVVGPCTGCTPPTLTINNLQGCTPNSVDLNGAIDPASDPATKTFYNSQNDANSATNAIGSSVTTAGSYWVRAVDPNDPTCFSVYEIQVTLTTVTYTTNNTNPSCGNSDGAIVITPGTGFTITDYSIDNGATTQTGGTFSNLAAGTYTIVITDVNGCEGTGTVTLSNAGSTDNASFTLTNFCVGTANSATITGTAGGTFTIVSPTGDGATISATTGEITNGVGGTTYTIKYETSSACPASETHTVKVNPSPTYTTNNTNPSCGNSDGKIVITPGTGFTITAYSIDNGATTQTGGTFSNLGAGSYTIYIKDNNGCEATGTENLSNASGPTIDNFSSTDASCNANDGTITVLASGGSGTLSYSLNTGQTSTDGTFTGLADGSYTVTVTDGNGCSTNESVTVGKASGPTIALVNNKAVSCFGKNDGSAEVSATGGATPYTYTWSPSGGSAATASGLAPGTYTAEVKDNVGCTDQIQIIITEPAIITINETITDSDCGQDNGEIALTVTGGTGSYTYSWNPNVSTTDQATGLAIGSYEVTVSDGNGCSQTVSYDVIQGNSFFIDATPANVTILQGESVEIHLFVDTTVTVSSIIWTPSDGLSCADCKDPIATPTNTTTYIVTVTDENGCTSTDTVVVNVILPCPEIFVPNTFSPNSDGLNDLQCVLGGCVASLDFTIFDRWGEVVFRTQDQKECWDGTFRGKLVQSDVYVYKLKATLENGEEIEQTGNITVVR